jgi:hypothetical protein
LQRVAVSEWVSVGGVSLSANLDLLLKAEVGRERKLSGEVLEEARDWIQRLPMHWQNPKKQSHRSYTGRAFAWFTPCVGRLHALKSDSFALGGAQYLFTQEGA